MNYYTRINPRYGGADGTDIVEFYRDGEMPETAWPVIVVRKAPATRWIPAAWTASCSDEFDGYSARFETKSEALAYAWGLVGN